MEDLFMEKMQELFLNANYEVDYEGRISKPDYIIIISIQSYEAETKTANIYVEYDFNERLYDEKYKFTDKSHHVTIPNIETPQQLFKSINYKFETIQNYYKYRLNIIVSFFSNFNYNDFGDTESFDNIDYERVKKKVTFLGNDQSGQQQFRANETYNLLKISSYIDVGGGTTASISFFYNPISSEMYYTENISMEEINYDEDHDSPFAVKYSIEELTSSNFLYKFEAALQELKEVAIEKAREQQGEYDDYFGD